jgi:hypothetical protein
MITLLLLLCFLVVVTIINYELLSATTPAIDFRNDFAGANAVLGCSTKEHYPSVIDYAAMKVTPVSIQSLESKSGRKHSYAAGKTFALQLHIRFQPGIINSS